jgi:hypothetical protein
VDTDNGQHSDLLSKLGLDTGASVNQLGGSGNSLTRWPGTGSGGAAGVGARWLSTTRTCPVLAERNCPAAPLPWIQRIRGRDSRRRRFAVRLDGRCTASTAGSPDRTGRRPAFAPEDAVEPDGTRATSPA